MINQDLKRDRVSNLIPATHAFDVFKDIANVAAEEAAIGAVLLNPAVYANVAEILQPADFCIRFNGYVWYALDKVTERNEPIELMTLADELEKHKELQNVDVVPRLTALLAACPDPNSAEVYAGKVRDAATLVRIVMAADSMKRLAADKTANGMIEEVIDECNRLLYRATDQNVTNNDTSAAAVIARYFGIVEDGVNGNVPPGVPTGFRSVDHLLKNLYPGEVAVLAGSEGMGKTSLLLAILRNVVKVFGMKAAIFSLEMTQDEIMRILIAMETGIPKDTLKALSLDPLEWSKFVTASGNITRWPLHIIDEFPAMTPLQLRRRLRRMLATEKLDLVVIDGLWLMEASEGGLDRPRAVSVIMRDLNQIARDFNVPILIAHQYNGDVWARQDKHPQMRDLAESAGVRRNAQVIFGLYRDAYYGNILPVDVTELHILKDRNGVAQGHHVELMYDLTHACYRDSGR